MEENNNILGNKLKNARIAKGYTVKDLSNACGVATMQIYNIEDGKSIPRPSTVKRICDALAVNFSEDLKKLCHSFYSNSRNILGITIREARISKGYTSKDLSNLSGISVSQIFSIEAGKGIPRERTLISLCAPLDIDYEVILKDFDYYCQCNDENILGNVIKNARIENGFTIKVLSDLSRVTPEQIRNIESGRSIPHPSTLELLCSALSLDYQETSKLSKKG